jgi:hypothetical protein
MPENMFDGSFGFGVDEGVLVLAHLVWVGTLLDARPLCNLSVIGAEGCLFGRKRCTHHHRRQQQYRHEYALSHFRIVSSDIAEYGPLGWHAQASEVLGTGQCGAEATFREDDFSGLEFLTQIAMLADENVRVITNDKLAGNANSSMIHFANEQLPPSTGFQNERSLSTHSHATRS